MSVALPEPMPWARPSVPAPGSSLTASTEAHAVHVVRNRRRGENDDRSEDRTRAVDDQPG